MADNTLQSGADTIATDDLTTLNGGAVSGVKAQRMKVGYGSDASLRDVDASYPLPVTESDGEQALAGGMTSLRDRLFAQRYTVLGDSIADGLATWWTSSVTNGGTTTVVTGEGLIQTSANAIGTAQLVSSTVYYYPGQVSWFNSAMRVGDTGSAGNIRRWGAFTVSGTTPQNGFYYELNGTTLNAVSVSAGTPTAVASTSWTKFATAPFTLDTSYHQFEIRYTSNAVQFYIDGILRHSQSGGAAPITGTLSFPMTLQSLNTSGATNRVLGVRNIALGRFGTPEINYVQGYQPSASVFSAVTATGAQAAVVASSLNVATLTLRTFTGTTPSVTFSLQASDDGTNWVTIQGINNSTGAVSSTWTQASALSAGTAGPSVDYAVGGYTQVRINVTAISGTSASATFGLSLQAMPYEPSPGLASMPALPSRTTGGLTTFTLISAATTNATSVKASAGTLYAIQASNTGAANAFLKIYNKASAPTVGTDVAVKTIILPAGGGTNVYLGDIGSALPTGIAIAVTALATTADTTAVALSQVVVNMDYA